MKPLKDTRLGKFLSSKGLDHLLEGVGDFVPGAKILWWSLGAVPGSRTSLRTIAGDWVQRAI